MSILENGRIIKACHRQWVIFKSHQIKKERRTERKLEEERTLAEEVCIVL